MGWTAKRLCQHLQTISINSRKYLSSKPESEKIDMHGSKYYFHTEIQILNMHEREKDFTYSRNLAKILFPPGHMIIERKWKSMEAPAVCE